MGFVKGKRLAFGGREQLELNQNGEEKIINSVTSGVSIGGLEIGTRVLPAPMAGFSDRSFRDIVRRFGCELVYTEMVSAEGLVRHNRRTWELLEIDDEAPPVGVQLFGHNAASLAKAAHLLEEKGASLIDLNLGCPVRKIVRGGAGAALLNSPELVVKLVHSVRGAISVPLTVKLRSGTERHPRAALELAPLLESEGVDAVCLHPRTLKQGFSGKADWSLIGELKSCIKIPVIGNGDILCGKDARQMMVETGCDAVMIGRGAVGNPWIFREARAALGEIHPEMPSQPSVAERINLAISHIETLVKRKGEERGVREFRKHAMYYFRGLREAGRLRSAIFRLRLLDEVKEFLTAIAYG